MEQASQHKQLGFKALALYMGRPTWGYIASSVDFIELAAFVFSSGLPWPDNFISVGLPKFQLDFSGHEWLVVFLLITCITLGLVVLLGILLCMECDCCDEEAAADLIWVVGDLIIGIAFIPLSRVLVTIFDCDYGPDPPEYPDYAFYLLSIFPTIAAFCILSAMTMIIAFSGIFFKARWIDELEHERGIFRLKTHIHFIFLKYMLFRFILLLVSVFLDQERILVGVVLLISSPIPFAYVLYHLPWVNMKINYTKCGFLLAYVWVCFCGFLTSVINDSSNNSTSYLLFITPVFFIIGWAAGVLRYRRMSDQNKGVPKDVLEEREMAEVFKRRGKDCGPAMELLCVWENNTCVRYKVTRDAGLSEVVSDFRKGHIRAHTLEIVASNDPNDVAEVTLTGITLLANFIISTPVLRKISLRDFALTKKMLNVFAGAIQQHGAITCVSVRDCGLDKNAAIAMINMLKEQQSLRRIDLGDSCKIDSEEIVCILKEAKRQDIELTFDKSGGDGSENV